MPQRGKKKVETTVDQTVPRETTSLSDHAASPAAPGETVSSTSNPVHSRAIATQAVRPLTSVVNGPMDYRLEFLRENSAAYLAYWELARAERVPLNCPPFSIDPRDGLPMVMQGELICRMPDVNGPQGICGKGKYQQRGRLLDHMRAKHGYSFKKNKKVAKSEWRMELLMLAYDFIMKDEEYEGKVLWTGFADEEDGSSTMNSGVVGDPGDSSMLVQSGLGNTVPTIIKSTEEIEPYYGEDIANEELEELEDITNEEVVEGAQNIANEEFVEEVVEEVQDVANEEFVEEVVREGQTIANEEFVEEVEYPDNIEWGWEDESEPTRDAIPDVLAGPHRFNDFGSDGFRFVEDQFDDTQLRDNGSFEQYTRGQEYEAQSIETNHLEEAPADTDIAYNSNDHPGYAMHLDQMPQQELYAAPNYYPQSLARPAYPAQFYSTSSYPAPSHSTVRSDTATPSPQLHYTPNPFAPFHPPTNYQPTQATAQPIFNNPFLGNNQIIPFPAAQPEGMYQHQFGQPQMGTGQSYNNAEARRDSHSTGHAELHRQALPSTPLEVQQNWHQKTEEDMWKQMYNRTPRFSDHLTQEQMEEIWRIQGRNT